MDKQLSLWGLARAWGAASFLLCLWISSLSGCATSSSAKHGLVAPHSGESRGAQRNAAIDKKQIGEVLDDWHEAASAADEERYFAHFAPDGVFMGTDATERWDVAAFRTYAHPHFAKGKAWSFRAVRRAVMVDGELGWFDEDLATPNLGPARGSGVMRYDGKAWRIVHYNLTITVPNERFKEVKALLDNAK